MLQLFLKGNLFASLTMQYLKQDWVIISFFERKWTFQKFEFQIKTKILFKAFSGTTLKKNIPHIKELYISLINNCLNPLNHLFLSFISLCLSLTLCLYITHTQTVCLSLSLSLQSLTTLSLFQVFLDVASFVSFMVKPNRFSIPLLSIIYFLSIIMNIITEQNLQNCSNFKRSIFSFISLLSSIETFLEKKIRRTFFLFKSLKVLSLSLTLFSAYKYKESISIIKQICLKTSTK